MKKLMKNKKLLFGIMGFVIGISITGVVAYSIYANKVTYDNTGSGAQSTDVQGAIDELYIKTDNGIPIDPDTFQTNTSKTVYASKLGVCIKRNNKLNCFKINNWDIEKDHIQQVFSDISCNVTSSDVNCGAADFYCHVRSDGYVNCVDISDYSHCSVISDGSVGCD